MSTTKAKKKIRNPLTGQTLSDLIELENAVEDLDVFSNTGLQARFSEKLLIKRQKSDQICRSLFRKMHNTRVEERQVCLRRGVLCRKLCANASMRPHDVQVIIPKSLQRRAIAYAHTLLGPPHWSPWKTLFLLQEICTFEDMAHKVNVYCINCKNCRKIETGGTKMCSCTMAEALRYTDTPPGEIEPFNQPYSSKYKYDMCTWHEQGHDFYLRSGMNKVCSFHLLSDTQHVSKKYGPLRRAFIFPTYYSWNAAIREAFPTFTVSETLLCVGLRTAGLDTRFKKIVVPRRLQQCAIEYAHSFLPLTHWNAKKTLAFLGELCFFENMEDKVSKYVSECQHCKRLQTVENAWKTPTVYQRLPPPYKRRRSYRLAHPPRPNTDILTNLSMGA